MSIPRESIEFCNPNEETALKCMSILRCERFEDIPKLKKLKKVGDRTCIYELRNEFYHVKIYLELINYYSGKKFFRFIYENSKKQDAGLICWNYSASFVIK